MTTSDHTPAELPTLVVIRGNSGSGKSTIAAEVRRRYGRGCALIEQDYLRRVVLREHGSTRTPTVAPGFITTTVRAALGAGYHVVLEGILHTGQYGALLRELIADHPGRSAVFWMDVPFDETVRRHVGRPGMAHISAQTMASWYVADDLLGVDGEQRIAQESTVEQSVAAILHGSGLAEAAALTPCPMLCGRCAEKRDAVDILGSGKGSGAVATVHRTYPSGERTGGDDGVPEAGIWEVIAASRAWLDEHNGTAEPELGLRILKVVEEAGEAAAAWIGAVGQNPRKGVTHDRQDVADELGDVAVTALVAAASLGFDPRTVLARVAGKVSGRLDPPLAGKPVDLP